MHRTYFFHRLVTTGTRKNGHTTDNIAKHSHQKIGTQKRRTGTKKNSYRGTWMKNIISNNFACQCKKKGGKAKGKWFRERREEGVGTRTHLQGD